VAVSNLEQEIEKLIDIKDRLTTRELTEELVALIEAESNRRVVAELRKFCEWVGEDSVDVQTGKDNVDYYLEERSQLTGKGEV
jgi:hypothetical protein